jgi:hypothetical protein
MLGRYSALLVIPSLLISGCAPKTLRFSATEKAAMPAQEREANIVHIEKGEWIGESPTCSTTQKAAPELAALTTAAIGVAVDFAVGLVSAQLKYLKEGRNGAWFATGATQALSEPGTYCVLVIRGVLQGRYPKAHADSPRFLGYKFTNHPSFELRANLTVKAPEGTTKTVSPAILEPKQLVFAETSAPVRGKNRKDVVVTIALSPKTLQPDAKAKDVPDTKDAASVFRLDFGRLAVGKSYAGDLLKPVAAAGSLTPSSAFMTTAVVTESEAPSVALDTLVSAFDGNKDKLSAAFKELLAGAGEKK